MSSHAQNPSPSEGMALPENLSEDEVRRLAAHPQWHAPMRALLGADDDHHLSLATLHTLAARPTGGDELPPHLLTCPVCLELYEIVKDGVPPIPPTLQARLEALCPPAPVRLLPSWRRIAAAAAAVVLLAAFGAWLARDWVRDTGRVASGRCTLSDGRALTAGATIPAHQVVRAQEDAALTLADGSRLTFEPQTRFDLMATWNGRLTPRLISGELEAEVVHQAPRHPLTIETPLGRIIVVGTRFRIRTVGEPTQVYRQDAGGVIQEGEETVQAVMVSVLEGVVRVQTERDEATVPAGTRAILRSGRPLIEVEPLSETRP